MKHAAFSTVCALVILACIGGGPRLPALADGGESAAVAAAKKAQLDAMTDPGNDTLLDKFLATLGASGHGSGSFIMEGDLPMTREEIRGYLITRHREMNKTTSELDRSSRELLVHVLSNNDFDYWSAGQRTLAYAVDSASFANTKRATNVRQRFRQAATEWENACPECGVSFVDVTDQSSPQVKPTFRIRFLDRADDLVAESFFPSYAESRRILFVYPAYFGTQFDPVGVFRHEIGHILGYAHEHIQNITGCATENLRWQQLSDYTANSVMHYFCGNGGSWLLALQENDKQGHRCLYKTGRPCPLN